MLIEWNAHVKETACNSKDCKGRVMATEGKMLTERANKSRSQIRLHCHPYHQIFVTMYESLLPLLSSGTDQQFSVC